MRAQLQLRSSLPDEVVRSIVGKRGNPQDAPVLLAGDASAFKPNGERLLTLVRGAFDRRMLDGAWPFMWGLRKHVSTNRGAYGGDEALDDGRAKLRTGTRYLAVKKDGTISKTNHANPVRSVVAGAFDRSPRIPFCRQTAYSTDEPQKWGEALPFIQRVGELFREIVPDRAAAQQEQADRTQPAYVIPRTPFTTITVNNTVAGTYHTDKGDFPKGFGVMAVMRKGHYRGAELVFPKYGVGADLQHGDCIFFDPHEVHGNLAFYEGIGKEAEDWVRISMVFYFRTKMVECLEPKAELERAKNVRGGIE